MRIYLSGKITGREKEDYTRQFARAESFYKTGGFDVVNPVAIGEVILKNNPKAKWEDFMQEDLTSRGKRSSMPQPKTRPDSPVPSLQGPCDRSLKSEEP